MTVSELLSQLKTNGFDHIATIPSHQYPDDQCIVMHKDKKYNFFYCMLFDLHSNTEFTISTLESWIEEFHRTTLDKITSDDLDHKVVRECIKEYEFHKELQNVIK